MGGPSPIRTAMVVDVFSARGCFTQLEYEAVGRAAQTFREDEALSIVLRVTKHVARGFDDEAGLFDRFDHLGFVDSVKFLVIRAGFPRVVDDAEDTVWRQDGMNRAKHGLCGFGATPVVDIMKIECRQDGVDALLGETQVVDLTIESLDVRKTIAGQSGSHCRLVCAIAHLQQKRGVLRVDPAVRSDRFG